MNLFLQRKKERPAARRQRCSARRGAGFFIFLSCCRWRLWGYAAGGIYKYSPADVPHRLPCGTAGNGDLSRCFAPSRKSSVGSRKSRNSQIGCFPKPCSLPRFNGIAVFFEEKAFPMNDFRLPTDDFRLVELQLDKPPICPGKNRPAAQKFFFVFAAKWTQGVYERGIMADESTVSSLPTDVFLLLNNISSNFSSRTDSFSPGSGGFISPYRRFSLPIVNLSATFSLWSDIYTCLWLGAVVK